VRGRWLAWPVEVVLISPHHPSCNAGIVNAPLLGLSQAANMSQMIGCRCTVALVHCSGRIRSQTQFVKCRGRQATVISPHCITDCSPTVRLVAQYQYMVQLSCWLFCQTGLLSVLWQCWLGDRKGIRSVKTGCWLVGHVIFDWSFACFIAPVVTTLPSPLAPIKSRMETMCTPFSGIVKNISKIPSTFMHTIARTCAYQALLHHCYHRLSS